jgi:thiamine kinase-like enzyme
MPKQASISGLEQQIVQYLGKLSGSVLGIEPTQPVEILDMTPGAYNLNFHVSIDGKRFIFRVNIQQQSGLAAQVDYESAVMEYLYPYEITPKVFHIDNTKTTFEFDILIEEYLEGPYIALTEEEMPAVAALLAKLHSLDASKLTLITWSQPLQDTLQLVQSDLQEYKAKKSADERVIALTGQFLVKIDPLICAKARIFAPDSINHTDVAVDNFIKTKNGLKLIDWEKPRFDDCSYDLCCFLAEPCQLWCLPEVLPPAGRDVFLKEYIRLSGRDEALVREKVRVREPLVALHWVFWGMNRLCDLKDQTTASALQEVHGEKVSRWERIADPRHIEKLIDMI